MAEPSKTVPTEAPDAADGSGDLELVARSQTGDTAAFNELVTRYRNRAFSMIYNMVRNEQDAWDLAQDGFVKAWKNIGRFRGQSSFYTWLYRILMNVGIDWLRRKHIEGGTEFNDAVGLHDIEPGALTAPRVELEPVAGISDKEIRTRIDAAILKLTPEHRAAIAVHGISPLHRRSFASIAYQQLALG